MREHWPLEPGVTFLNHGSYGACPAFVLQAQASLREHMEAEPVRFLSRELPTRLAQARAALARILGAQPDDLAFVTNATGAVNAVLRSLDIAPGDEILTTDHLYPGCHSALEYVARRAGARVVTVNVPFPLAHEHEVIEPLLAAAGRRVRLAVLDHVTSQTALVWPIGAIVRALRERGIETLVDGAHAPGMVPLSLDALGAAYYAGNCHKWLCAPKGAAFLHVRRDRQDGVMPTTVSYGIELKKPEESAFRAAFDWTGTQDPSAALSVPCAIDYLASLVPGGWSAIMARNRALALEARELLCGLLDMPVPAPASMIGSMFAIPLRGAADGLQEALWEDERIEVPVGRWREMPLLRVSTHLYNSEADIERLARALGQRL